jgi:hypothetical protein
VAPPPGHLAQGRHAKQRGGAGQYHDPAPLAADLSGVAGVLVALQLTDQPVLGRAQEHTAHRAQAGVGGEPFGGDGQELGRQG